MRNVMCLLDIYITTDGFNIGDLEPNNRAEIVQQKF